jgi:hypothetical protein
MRCDLGLCDLSARALAEDGTVRGGELSERNAHQGIFAGRRWKKGE